MVHPESIACLIRRCLVTMESPPPTGWRRSPDPLPHRAFGLSGSRRRGRQVSESSEECHHANQTRLCRNVSCSLLDGLNTGGCTARRCSASWAQLHQHGRWSNAVPDHRQRSDQCNSSRGPGAACAVANSPLVPAVVEQQSSRDLRWVDSIRWCGCAARSMQPGATKP